jgi:hypothetical protein
VIAGLPSESVLVHTFNNAGYLDELYNDIACQSCTLASGAPVAVTAGATTSGIDFSLARGGRISGTVTRDGSGIGVGGASVTLYTAQGVLAGSTATNGSGTYLSPGLPAGTYVVVATAAGGSIPELFDNITCVSCGPSQAVSGTPIVVTAGATTPEINFSLSEGAIITGTVRDGTNSPIGGLSVVAVNRSNVIVGDVRTNAQGGYTIGGLPAGTYYVRTNILAPLSVVNQVYNASGNLVCENCNAAQVGTVVVTSVTAPASGINFVLTSGGGILRDPDR